MPKPITLREAFDRREAAFKAHQEVMAGHPQVSEMRRTWFAFEKAQDALDKVLRKETRLKK